MRYYLIINGIEHEERNYSEAIMEMFWQRMRGHKVEFVMVSQHTQDGAK